MKKFSAWHSDWQSKRFLIEQRFLPLVEFAIKGNLLDSLDGVLKILQEYKVAVDKFYLQERKNIYQKFAFQAGGELQEKFETESKLFKPTEKFQRSLQEIIFAREKSEERIFLLRWAEPLLNFGRSFIAVRRFETSKLRRVSCRQPFLRRGIGAARKRIQRADFPNEKRFGEIKFANKKSELEEKSSCSEIFLSLLFVRPFKIICVIVELVAVLVPHEFFIVGIGNKTLRHEISDGHIFLYAVFLQRNNKIAFFIYCRLDDLAFVRRSVFSLQSAF